MKIEVNTSVKLELNDIINGLQNLNNRQKIEIVKKLAYWSDCIDMTYIENALTELSKIELKRIKKNRELYNRNRKYFQAIKTISKTKSAE